MDFQFVTLKNNILLKRSKKQKNHYPLLYKRKWEG
jgi:hypothetical protein